MPAAVAGLTLGVKTIALNLNVSAGLDVSSPRQSAVAIVISVAIAIVISISVVISVVAVAAAAAKSTVDVDDALVAAFESVKRGPHPPTILGLAPRAKVVATNVNGRAGLHVGTGRNPGSPAARELPVVIHNFANAMVDVVQRSPRQSPVHCLAARAQGVAANADLAAGLPVRAPWQ
jgi:hypothetical protein